MTVRILTGDCRDILRTLPDESVHCVVTSPPYWGLRDYGTGKWEGGDPQCDHLTFKAIDRPPDLVGGGFATWSSRCATVKAGGDCKCGARRIDSQLGLEPDSRDYLKAMVEVFREVKRVLRKDGTCWINMGDCYASSVNGRRAEDIVDDDRTFRDKPFSTVGGVLKPKDLVGMPWRLALALQEDGWWLRSDVIWAKPNPMPESVTDRPTKAHEYLFLLSKAERYYYDAEAIKEGVTGNQHSGRKDGGIPRPRGGNIDTGGARLSMPGGLVTERNRRTVWWADVWEIATAPFSESHFATFPPALVEPCIKAGCPKDGWVLDPFGGAGTVGLVADRLGRNAILIELNPEYARMAENRLRDDAGLFYNADDDFAKSLNEAYDVIRERQANGGPGWVPK